jgi:hypothetical protein
VEEVASRRIFSVRQNIVLPDAAKKPSTADGVDT